MIRVLFGPPMATAMRSCLHHKNQTDDNCIVSAVNGIAELCNDGRRLATLSSSFQTKR